MKMNMGEYVGKPKEVLEIVPYMTERKTKYVPMNGIEMAIEGVLETSGLVACISCAGYFRKGDKKYAFLSHYPAPDPTQYLSRILNFRDKHLELRENDFAELLVFRLTDSEISDELRYVQPYGNIQTYRQNLEIIRIGLSHQFPNSRIEERTYRTPGSIKIDIDNSSWKSNTESGNFDYPKANDCVEHNLFTQEEVDAV